MLDPKYVCTYARLVYCGNTVMNECHVGASPAPTHGVQPPLPIAGTKIVLLELKKAGWLVGNGISSTGALFKANMYVCTYVQGQAVVGRKE